jgi:hypothetical protein
LERLLVFDDPAIVSEGKRLFARLGFSPSYAALDLLGTGARISFDYLEDICPALFAELLSSALIPPQAFPSAFRFLPPGRGTLLELIDLLQFEVLEFGIDFASICLFSNIPIELEAREHHWIASSELHATFAAARGDFTTTDFGRLVGATLDALIANYDFELPDSLELEKLALLLSFIVHIYDDQSSSLLLLICQDFVNRGRTPSSDVKLRAALDRVWRQDLPLSSAPSLARLAILCEGAAAAAARHVDLFSAAAAADRDLARQIATHLPPLPPIPTFLAFAGLPKFTDYVNICQCVIPVEQWVLRPGDASVIAQLPQNSAAPHAAALERVAALSRPGMQQAVRPASLTRAYSFTEPVVVEIAARPRPTEPPTAANLRAFLWHGGRQLSDPGTADSSVRECPTDARMLTAFFTWASVYRYPIDVAEWAGIVRLAPERATVATVAALLQHIRPPTTLPPVVVPLVELAFGILGFPFTDESVFALACRGSGPGWLLARNLMRADYGKWLQRPFTVCALARDIDGFVALLPQLTLATLPEALAAAAALLLEPSPYEVFLYDDTFPDSYSLPPELLGFLLDLPLPRPREVDQRVLDALLSALAPLAPLPLVWVDFFGLITLSEDDLVRVRGLFDFEAPGISRALPTLFPIGGRKAITAADGSIDSDIAAFFAGAPPSAARAFARGISNGVLPASLLTRELWAVVSPLFPPIFPGLAYAGTACLGLRYHWESTALSALRFGVFSEAIGAALAADLGSRSRDALAICVGLLRLPPEFLPQAMTKVTPAMAREEVLRSLIESAVMPEATPFFAFQAIQCALYASTPEELMVIVANKAFLRKPNFACVFVIFRYFVLRVARRNGGPALEFCEMLQKEETDVFSDELRKNAIADLDAPESVAAALQEYCR